MNTNVHIEHFQRGVLVEERHAHNVWTQAGHEYLAELATLISFVPSIPERTDRIKYLGLGIGGKLAGPDAFVAPYSTAYPAGSDPQLTAGNEYNVQYPVSPLIASLERPLRVSGGVNPYPGDPGDVWLIEPPNLYCTHTVATTHTLFMATLNVHVTIDGSIGEYVYGPFTNIPVSEAALFTSDASTGVDYNTAVAYVTFAPFALNALSLVRLNWRIQFV